MHLNLPGVMLLLRVTARISGVLLAGSFGSLAFRRLWPSSLTQRMAANRHRLTLLFALSHTVHLSGVVMLAILIPGQFLSKRGLAVLIPGGVGYALIYYLAWMALTRRTKPDLPDTKMQTFSMYILWAIFTLAFTAGLWRNPWTYAPLAFAMWMAFSVRVWPRPTLKRVAPVSAADR